jgi:dipeptidase E
MNVILTSDFPATPTSEIVDRVRATAAAPRIAWVASYTDTDGGVFGEARRQFQRLGFEGVECVDIDQDRDDVQIAYLHEFDVIYLSGGDPVRFRYNAIRSGLAGRLRQCLAGNRLVVAAGGGSLLLTPNVSLVRLDEEPVDRVLAERPRFDALGAVSYELLPHSNRRDATFLDRVRAYSSAVPNDIVCLSDGGAMFCSGRDTYTGVGPIARYRKGNIIES